MSKNGPKNRKPSGVSHESDSLYTEWPSPSEVVEGFGGNPKKADHTQWNEKDTPGSK